MAAIYGLTWTVYWIVLPITLIASVIFRYNLLSCVYLIFLLGLPYSPRLHPDKIASWASYALTIVIMSGLFLLGLVGFQIALLAQSPYGSFLGDACSQAESIARYVGYERFDKTDIGNLLRLLFPDIGVFVVSLGTYIMIRKTIAVMTEQQSSQGSQHHKQPKASSVRLKNASVLCVSMLFMALAGIALPSVISCIYLFVFIIFSLLWACHQPLLVPALAAARASLSSLTILQLLMLFIYQLKFTQDFIPPDAIYSRLLGLTAIIDTDCDSPYKLLLKPNLPWTTFVSPACIFLLHWSLAVGVRMFYQDLNVIQQRPEERSASTSSGGILSRRPKQGERKDKEYEETPTTLQPLVQGEEIPHSYDAVDSIPQTSGEDHVYENAVEDPLPQDPKNKGLLQKISGWFSDVRNFSFYVVALIIMMLWSVTYHSWLTFVLLLWSCVLWMTKDKAKCTLYSSPAFVVYGILLVLLQYVYSLDLNESELPTQINQTNGDILYLSAFGLRRFEFPCLHLGAQILYLCGFLLVLHQFNHIRKNPITQEAHGATTGTSWTEKAASYLNELLCQYWIFVVIGFHLAVATEGIPTGIKVIYMLFFLLNIATYSISWSAWRRTLTLYWTVLVIYTMLVLALIYTYQFQSFPSYWKSLTNFSDIQLHDLGLEQANNSGDLLLMILIPALFLLVVILQMQYFNKRFLELTGQPTVISQRPSNASDHPVEQRASDEYEMNELSSEEKSDGNWLSQKLENLWPVLDKTWISLTSFIMRGFEFHVWRLVFITVFAAAAYQVSALYAVFVVVWITFLACRGSHTLLFVISSSVASLIVLGVMFYQLQFINEDEYLTYNCTTHFYGENLTMTYHLTNWIGVQKMTVGYDSFFYHVEGYLAIILMVAFERTIVRRQEWRRLWRNEPPFVVTAFYPSVTWNELDSGILNCAKYFVNYFFFKFGVEACFIMTVITVWVRMDIFAIVYCILLIIALILKTRADMFRYWRFYVGFLIILYLWQYMASLGLPPLWCQNHEYPWTTIGSNKTIRNRLVRWLYLPDYIVDTDNISSIADFFQLLFVVSQLFVFEREAAISKFVGDTRYLTGDELDQITVGNNPKKNFMLKGSRTILDQLKVFVFKYMIWITMAIIFLAGTSRISIFTLGYLISFFYILSKQQTLLMGKPSRLLRVFTILLSYTVTVITLKTGLQIASCVYIETLASKACAFVQLMSLVCSKPDAYNVTSDSDSCELSYDNAGLTWDFVCFLFLLIQRRIFGSYYFLHVAEDLRISMQLAARGAELFNDKLIEEVKEREQLEEENITAIKKSMQSIKDRYQTLRRGLPLLTSHVDATRSGDYYMFDESAERRDLSKRAEHDIMDPIDMLHKVDTIGIDKTLRDREHDKMKLEETLPIEEGDEKVDEDAPPASPGGMDVALVDDTGSHHSGGSHCSGDEDSNYCDENDKEVEDVEEKSMLDKIKQGCRFVLELFLSSIDSLTLLLNKINRDYRNVILQLESEKDELSNEKFKREISPRNSTSDVMINIDDAEAAKAITQRRKSEAQEWVDLKPIDFDKDQHRLIKLFYAIWFIVISRTDFVCYLLIILNLMIQASLIALVLPLSVFLWANFSIPRPTKVFWTFVIVYLEVIIVIKFIFQFEFFPWNSQEETNINLNDPFWWPRFVGIVQSSSWGVMELLQLLAVVFHISILKVHGLWDNADNCNADDTEDEEMPSTSHAAIQEVGGLDEANTEVKVGKEKETVGQRFKAKILHYGVSAFDWLELRFNYRAHGWVEQGRRVVRYCKQPYYLYATVLNQRFSSVTDIYVYMFLCDVINFIIIIFGYNAFGQYATQESDVVTNIQSNNVPTGFLIMLIIQFTMMFIDRGIYLKKSLFGKVVFQIILVVGIHIWMFFILPSLNNRPFYENTVAQTWYFFKVLYFLLSAYQIRAGYPKRVSGNFLTKSYGTANLFLYKGYRAIPFLAEITAIMDWMYSETSMSIGEWMKLWSIHAEVFELKCWRVFEIEYPSSRGKAKSKWIKYLIGGFLVFILIAIIWFPLLLMNIALTIGGIPNNPTQVDIKITLGAFEPIFQVVADADDIQSWSKEQFSDFSATHSQEAAASFLQSFSNNQVVSVSIDGESKTVWIISPPQRSLLLERLSTNNTKRVRLLFEWTLTKDAATTSVITAYGYNEVYMNQTDKSRAYLYELLNGNKNVSNVTIPHLFPQYIHSPGASSRAVPASSIYIGDKYSPITDGFKDVDFTIQTQKDNPSTSWWSVYEQPNVANQPKINMVIFSDKVSPSSLSFLVSYGIIGLYVSIVLVVGRLVRSVFIGTTASIMFTELPYVDRILQLCQDIFLVREEEEYELEEDLYAKIIFLYRSPKTLIQWTKPKVE